MSFIAKKFIELINDYTEDHIDVEAIEREAHNENVSDIQESSGFDKNGQYVEKESYMCKGEITNKKKQTSQAVWTIIAFAIMFIMFLISCLLELIGLS